MNDNTKRSSFDIILTTNYDSEKTQKPRKACFSVILKHFCSTSCSCIEKNWKNKKKITEANLLTISHSGWILHILVSFERNLFTFKYWWTFFLNWYFFFVSEIWIRQFYRKIRLFIWSNEITIILRVSTSLLHFFLYLNKTRTHHKKFVSLPTM